MSVMLPDISKWYTPDRVAVEDAIWIEGQHYRENVQRIAEVCRSRHLRTVMEFGCGTGLVAANLPASVEYLMGIDDNYHMLERARERNSKLEFIHADIRTLQGPAHGTLQADLVCSFAVLKHFSLSEWPAILRIILAHGTYALFNMHALPDDREPFDAGTEWHSAWPRRCDIVAAISAAGHKVIDWDDSHIDPLVGAPEAYITTRRV